LDVDLEKSIRIANRNPLQFTFAPILYAFSGIGRGDLAGTVFPTDLNPAIFAISGKDSVSTHTNTSGAFLFKLKPGKYTLYFEPKDSRYLSDTLFNVEVKSNQPTTLDRITLKRK
jgi:hypothetical protein